MLQSARYVPITLMQYVLRWGQRSPDPQHVTNAFRITEYLQASEPPFASFRATPKFASLRA